MAAHMESSRQFAPPHRLLADGTFAGGDAEARWAEAMVARSEAGTLVRPESDPIWDRMAAELESQLENDRSSLSPLPDAAGSKALQVLAQTGEAPPAGRGQLDARLPRRPALDAPLVPPTTPSRASDKDMDSDDAWYDQLIAHNTAMSVCDPVQDGPPMPAQAASTAVDDCDSDSDGWYDQLIEHSAANSIVDSGNGR